MRPAIPTPAQAMFHTFWKSPRHGRRLPFPVKEPGAEIPLLGRAAARSLIAIRFPGVRLFWQAVVTQLTRSQCSGIQIKKIGRIQALSRAARFYCTPMLRQFRHLRALQGQDLGCLGVPFRRRMV